MSRPIRISYPGAAYHVMSRGNFKNQIFRDKKDYEIFLGLFSDILERHNVICYSYCLMPNHYHLFLETPDPNLSEAMRHLNGIYTQKFNLRHKQYGHLFQGRFKSVLVEKELYKYELIRYIALNPVRAKLVRNPSEWKWSSHNEIIGKQKKPSMCLDLKEVLGFYAKDKKIAQKNYLENISLKMEEDFCEKIENGVILGGQSFLDKIKDHFTIQSSRKEIPKTERFANRPALSSIFNDLSVDKKQRNTMIKVAYDHGYSLTAIGKKLGLHYTTVSKIVNK